MLRSGQRIIINASKISARSLSSGIIEIRSYTAKPEMTKDYLALASDSAKIRKQYCGDNWKLFLSAETGYGNYVLVADALLFNPRHLYNPGSLSDFVHLYTYENLDHRASSRKALGADSSWQKFLEKSRTCLTEQRSEIFVPAKVPGVDVKYFADNSMGPVSTFSDSVCHIHRRTKNPLIAALFVQIGYSL